MGKSRPNSIYILTQRIFGKTKHQCVIDVHDNPWVSCRRCTNQILRNKFSERGMKRQERGIWLAFMDRSCLKKKNEMRQFTSWCCLLYWKQKLMTFLEPLMVKMSREAFGSDKAWSFPNAFWFGTFWKASMVMQSNGFVPIFGKTSSASNLIAYIHGSNATPHLE